MTTSVVLTTYNGQKYIMEQLDSLFQQTRMADEVLVLDDKSTDDTVEIVREFIKAHHLKNWEIVVNEKNLGWKQNFVNGFKIAKGDLIFPCDQDDIWKTDKISVMADAMEQNQQIDVLIGKAECFFEKTKADTPSKNTMADYFSVLSEKISCRKKKCYTNEIYSENFDFTYRNVQQGCKMCIRKTFWNEIKEYWFPQFAHDRILSYYAKLKGSYYLLDYPVISYRFHAGSASNPTKKNRLVRLAGLEIDSLEINNLKKNVDYFSNSVLTKKTLQHAEKWNNYRISLVNNKNVFSGIKLLRYLRFYPRKKHYLSDWYYALKGNGDNEQKEN